MDKCQDCGSPVTLSGAVSCWCDKDFCQGQRCGADDMFDKYQCTNKDCNKTGTPPETDQYRRSHM